MSGTWVGALAAGRTENWAIAKAHGLWGTRSNRASAVRAGDELYIWQSGDGWLARCSVLTDAAQPTPANPAPWTDLTYRWIFKIDIIDEKQPPLPLAAPGKVQVRTGIPTIQLGQFHLLDPVKALALRNVFDDSTSAATPTAAAAPVATQPDTTLLASSSAGREYVYAHESVTTTHERTPFTVDPNEQDRALQAHAKTQNLLADFLISRGFQPLSPRPEQPQFDVAWRADEVLHVAEVKSLPPGVQTNQLRFGLGQLLEYAHRLDAKPVLMLEKRPSDNTWLAICASHGVLVGWPDALDRVLNTT